MKKYLLLLVLAISSATCFAQQHQPSTVSPTAEPINEQLELLNVLGTVYDKFTLELNMFIQSRPVYNDILIFQEAEEYNNPVIAMYISEIYSMMDSFKEYLDEIGKYIGEGGSILTEDKVNEIRYKADAAVDDIWQKCEVCAATYHEVCLPFLSEIESTQNLVNDLLAQINEKSQLMQYAYYNSANNYTSRLSELAKKVNESMAANTLIEDSEGDKGYNAQLQSYRDEIDRLIRGIDCAEAAEKKVLNAIDTLETECPDVKDNYLTEILSIKDELYRYIRAWDGDFYYMDLYTDRYINRISNIISDIDNILAEARAEQGGLTAVEKIEVSGNEGAVYYNINGVNVSNPAAGSMLIKVDANGKTHKVIVR